jgi:hypothetical protein
MWHKLIKAYLSTVSDGEKLLAKKAKSKVFSIDLAAKSINSILLRF